MFRIAGETSIPMWTQGCVLYIHVAHGKYKYAASLLGKTSGG